MDSDQVAEANKLIDEVHQHLDELRALIQAEDFDSERYREVHRLWHTAQSELNNLLPPVIDPI